MGLRPRHKRHAAIREEWRARLREADHALDVHVIGIPYHVQIEPHPNEVMVDHVWYDVELPEVGRIRLSINTLSRLNERAGFDPRVRVGIIPSTYEERPACLIEECRTLDYRDLDREYSPEYTLYDHDPLEALLLAKGTRAVRVEAWGALYVRDHLGVHQLHSRRASCALEHDVVGQDGGLKLYYPDLTAELLLFKFCGQA